MNMKAIVSGSLMALLASSAIAQSLDPVRIEMFRSILQGNNCVLTEAQATNILPRFDFAREETRAIVGALVAAGEVRLDGNTLNLVDGSCGSDDPVADLLAQRDVQQFIAVMAEHGCAMTEAEGETVFLARGISKAQVGAMLGPMMQNGMANFDAGQGMLSVTSAYCSPATVVADVEEAPEAAGIDLAKVEQMRAVFAQNGCRMSEDQMGELLPAAGFSRADVGPIFNYLEASGELQDVNNDAVLTGDYCPQAEVAAPVAITEIDRSGMFGLGRVRELVDVMAQNSCTLNLQVADQYIVEAGIDHGFAKFSGGKMVRDGFATMAADGENIVLAVPYCIPAGGGAVNTVAVTAEIQPQPQPAVAENDGSPEALFYSVMAQNGCSMAEPLAQEAFPAAGLRMDQAYRIVDGLIDADEASYSENGEVVNVTNGHCIAQGAGQGMQTQPVAATSSEFPASPEGVFLAMMRRNSCSMSLSDARAQFPVAGMRAEQLEPLLDEYLQNGRIRMSADGSTISHPDPACYPTPGATDLTDPQTDEFVAQRQAAQQAMAAAQAPAVPDSSDPRAGLLAMLAANGCEVTQGNAAALIAAAGLEFGPSMQILTQMMGDGSATSPDGGQTLQVGPPLCMAATAAPQTPREVFINLIKQNNCSITAAEFSTLLPVDGLDASAAFAMISDLEAEGVITLPVTRDVVTLSAENCR